MVICSYSVVVITVDFEIYSSMYKSPQTRVRISVRALYPISSVGRAHAFYIILRVLMSACGREFNPLIGWG